MLDDPLSEDEQLEVACGLLDRQPRALSALLTAYGGRVKRLLLNRFHEVLTEQDADAVLNHAAFKAWSSTFDAGQGTLGGWFYTIAHNTAVDLIRGEGRWNGMITMDSAPEPSIDGRVPALLADDEELPDEVVEDLRCAIEELGEIQRKIVKADLAAGGEADAEELSRRLGIPKQHVYSYREKYRRSLLKRMTKRGHSAESIERRQR